MSEMTFDVMPNREGRRGAWVFNAGLSWREQKDYDYLIVDVLGVRCWFISPGMELPSRDWCYDFATRSLSNDASIQRMNLADFSVTVKSTGKYR